MEEQIDNAPGGNAWFGGMAVGLRADARRRPDGDRTRSIEDETGVSNAVVMPDVFERERVTLLENSYLVIEGELQNLENVISVKAARIQALHVAEMAVPSHDFH